jgi:adenosine 3'-phospho 5'-phosphosulfate transporter B2
LVTSLYRLGYYFLIIKFPFNAFFPPRHTHTPPPQGISLIQSGEGAKSLFFIFEDSLAMYHQVVLSITSAVGQLFIFYTIKEFGPVIFTIFMTTRQIFSLFLSCILFAHSLSALSWIGASIVFSVVFYRIKRKGSD